MTFNSWSIKNISFRVALMTAAVGGIFLLVTLGFVANIFWSDSLIRYVPNDASFYIHLRPSKIIPSSPLVKMWSELARENSIADIDLKNINEVSIIGHVQDDALRLSLMVAPKNLMAAEKFLRDRNIIYTVNKNIIFIDPSGYLWGALADQKLEWPWYHRYSWSGAADIYVGEKYIALYNKCSWGTALRLLSSSGGNIYARAYSDSSGMFIAPLGAKSASRAGLSAREDANFDVVFSAESVKFLSNVDIACPDALVAYPEIGAAKDFITAVGNRKILLMLAKNQANTGWYLADYDIYGSIYGATDPGVLEKLEVMAKTMVATEFPREKATYLSDGTRILELKRDISQFSFIPGSSTNKLVVPKTKTAAFAYAVSKDKLILANSEALLANKSVWRGNYLYLKTALLPDVGLWHYLKNFTTIQVDGQGIRLK